jgi:GNAT superfamily N-acetyltransferase
VNEPTIELQSTDVEIAPADHGSARDRATVLALLEEYLATIPGEAAAARRYAWLYLDNPHGKAATYVARSATGEPAGLTSLFPRRVLCDGKVLIGAIGGDGYVRPAFRRRRIATRLHRAALEDMPRAGIDFMYGPPEPNNLKALLSSGATVVGEVRRFTRVLQPRRLGSRGPLAAVARLLLRPPASSLRLIPLSGVPDPRVDEVFNDASTEGDAGGFRIVPVRDAAFYAWRFGASPAGRQRPFLVVDGSAPVGLVVLDRSDGRTALCDLVSRRGQRRAVLGAVLHASRDDESVRFQCHVPAKQLERALHLAGFIPREGKPFQVQVRSNHPLRTLLVDPAAWLYTWGDGDVDHIG